jgi:hypothetical protein
MNHCERGAFTLGKIKKRAFGIAGFALALVFALVAALFFRPAVAISATAGDDLASTAAEHENPGLGAASITVRAKVPEDWAEPCLWAWLDPDGTAAFPAWPGEPFVKDGDWYALQAPGWVNSVIVNANGGAVQTGDMKALEPGKDLWIVVTGAEDYAVDYTEIGAAAPAAEQEEPKREEPKRETARQEATQQAAALREATQQADPQQAAALQEAALQEAATQQADPQQEATQQADPQQAAGTAARGGGNPVVLIIAVCIAAIAAIAVIAAVAKKKK